MARGCGSRSSWAPAGWRRPRRPQQQRRRHQRVRASEGAAAARGYGASRGSASCSNARARHIHVPLAPYPHATASFGASASWLRFSPLSRWQTGPWRRARSPGKRSAPGDQVHHRGGSGVAGTPFPGCGLRPYPGCRSLRRSVDRSHDPDAPGDAVPRYPRPWHMDVPRPRKDMDPSGDPDTRGAAARSGAHAFHALEERTRLSPADGAGRGGSAGVRGRPGCRSGWWRGWRGLAAIAARAGRRRG